MTPASITAFGYRITTARENDVPHLPSIEHAAARLFRGHVPQSVLEDKTAETAFAAAQADGRLWVALVEDAVVGFAMVEMLAKDLPHLHELDVHPLHGRRGVGTALVRTVCEWARRAGYGGVTLTTYRDIPWNMPFYSRLGFEEIKADLRPEICELIADEKLRGLDPYCRVVMKYRASVNTDSDCAFAKGDGSGLRNSNL